MGIPEPRSIRATMRLPLPFLILVLFLFGRPVQGASDSAIAIASLAGLAEAAAASGQTVTMQPGVYRMADFLPPSRLAERRKSGEFHLLNFRGNDNKFRLAGVTIEVDTAFREVLRPPIHTDEILVSGHRNLLEGLTIRHLGNGKSLGGAALGITGTGNTLRQCTLYVAGSFPYGYGDLFGKGGPDIIPPLKKSGVHITGSGTTVSGCKLFMHSFGHGFYVQEDAAKVHFEDCLVEGVMRPTDEILAETSGPAFAAGFRTVIANRRGEFHVTPGYMKSLSEDGFRTYGQHPDLTFRNCTAKNMRGGFELRTKAGVRLDNCAATGNERGFWVSTNAVVTGCRGDAQYGPLLFVEGDNATVDLELLPAESAMHVHALASIQGTGHQIALRPAAGPGRTLPIPILLGFGVPAMGDGMAPIPEREARQIFLRNQTLMPVLIGAKAREGEVCSLGLLQENHGTGVTIRPPGATSQTRLPPLDPSAPASPKPGQAPPAEGR